MSKIDIINKLNLFIPYFKYKKWNDKLEITPSNYII